MTLSELVSATWLRAKGKEFTGTTGDTNYNKIKAIANHFITVWQNEPGVDWASLYEPDYSIGTVTATDTYELDTSDIRKISTERGDSVRIVHTDDNFTDYQLVEPDTLKQYSEGAYCARVGDNLVFNHVFESTDPQFGGDIQVPKYGYVEALSGTSDEVPVNIPEWLVCMSASELIRNDVVRQNQYPNMLAEANLLMEKMKENQDAQINSVTRAFSAAGQSWA